MMATGWPTGSADWAGGAKSMAVESGVTGYSTTGARDSHPKNAYPLEEHRISRRDAACRVSRCVPRRRGKPRLHKVLGSDRITSWDSLLEGDRDVSPDLDG